MEKTQYVIRLMEKEHTIASYRVSRDIFLSIKEQIEPYRSVAPVSKKIRCIETGQIFKNAKAANVWLVENKKTSSYEALYYIKNVCKGKSNTAYGYRWEFAE